jgi:AcrR family transcriptional regulator
MPSKSDPVTSSVWTRSPRSRGEQPTLSRAQIVQAAIELLDAEGPAGLSMRRLGTRLGSGATSVYWHVANKDELLELGVDEVLAEVYVPEVGDTDWRTGASILTSGMRTMLLRHPWVIGQLGVRPTIGPNAMRMGDRMVALLAAAGFTGLDLAHASTLLMSHAIGSATTAAAVTTTSRQTGRPIDQMIKDVEPYLESIAADHPNYEKWWRASGVAAMSPEQLWDDSFAFGLERLLDGLQLWLDKAKT